MKVILYGFATLGFFVLCCSLWGGRDVEAVVAGLAFLFCLITTLREAQHRKCSES